MVEPAKQAENKQQQGRALRALVVGVNTWFCSAGYPWIFLDAPGAFMTSAHVAPLLVLMAGTAALAWDRTPGFLRRNATTSLLAVFPLSIAGALIAREQATQTLALTGPALLWCVLSLWVFVGVLTQETPPAPREGTRPARPNSSKRTWWTPLVIGSALITATVGPSWNLPPRGLQAWSDADLYGALLTTAVGTALALGMVLTVLGPSAIKPRPPTAIRWSRRVLPPLLLVVASGGTYLLIGR